MIGEEFRAYVGGIIKKTVVQNGEEKEIDTVDGKKFANIFKYLRVLGRSSPDDKYLLVTGI